MGNYKALFVGEPKVKKTEWRSREHAASCIVNHGLSVTTVYEAEDGKNFFDKSADVAELIRGFPDLKTNVVRFCERHGK